jgi:hypothetical protein
MPVVEYRKNPKGRLQKGAYRCNSFTMFLGRKFVYWVFGYSGVSGRRRLDEVHSSFDCSKFVRKILTGVVNSGKLLSKHPGDC